MIKVLDKSISDKIAAGEVIERPVSIVKELVENSIDAGARSVTVEIKKGGKSYIRVTDDGCGIPGTETETAFLRHATSKISKQSDLNAIETLGFRGEALASIAAVTRTELITKTRGSKMGTRLLIHGGDVILKEASGCPDGTTVIVCDLFYNTPARLKFMKSDASETAVVTEFLTHAALSAADVRFRFISNGKTVFSTVGNGDRLNAITRLFPETDTANLIKLNASDDSLKLKLEGYISTPAVSRSTRSGQVFFVNGRTVDSKVMEKAVMLGYRERLFEGRFPVCYLFLTADAAALDVNIHPNKKDVRFDNENQVSEFIRKAVSDTLLTPDSIPDYGIRYAAKANDIPLRNEEAASADISGRDRFVKLERELESIPVITPNSFKVAEKGGYREKYAGISSGAAEKSEPYKDREANSFETSVKAENFESQEQIDIKKILSTYRSESDIKAKQAEPELRNKSLVQENKEAATKENLFENIRITGVIFNTYIEATDDECFYLIDQHAAHERIFYEKLTGQYESAEKTSQQILVPIMLDVPHKSCAYSDEWTEALKTLGFGIEPFGDSTFRITEIPMFTELSEAEDFAKYFIENFTPGRQGGANDRNEAVYGKLIMMSCKAAVKAHDKLSDDEVKALISDLSRCRNPYSCPHGRPTFIKFTRYEIEKMFKRIV